MSITPETAAIIARGGAIISFLFFWWMQRWAKKLKPTYEFSWILQIIGSIAWPVCLPLFCCFCINAHIQKLRAEASDV